jgi:tetratricopeptide (TPR) repeat protein
MPSTLIRFAFLWLLSVAASAAAVHAQDAASVAAASPEPESTPVAEPSPDVQLAYRDVVARAVAEFEAGHLAEARALFAHAHALWPSARTLRTLGMTAFELRMYPRALEELQAALVDPRRPLPEQQRSQVESLIEQTRAFVGRYRVQLSPPQAVLSVDGAVHAAEPGPLILELGDHSLLVRAQGYSELRRALSVQGHEDQALPLTLERLAVATAPAEKPKALDPASAVTEAAQPNHTAAWIAFGVAAVGGVTGCVTGIVALTKKHEDVETGKTVADVSTGAFIVAGAAAALGVVLWVTATPEPTHENPTHARLLRPAIGFGSLSIAGQL